MEEEYQLNVGADDVATNNNNNDNEAPVGDGYIRVLAVL